MFENRVWTELRKLREAEASLQAMYETLPGAEAETGRSFMVSLRALDERLRRLESFLESAA
ncbi:MAG: hypothetical protein JWO19_3920 [Bryobacterales bacterium]|jgi:hypothetical protein|nr:hypothetical protein [Bryobacterales bacterium]